MYVKLFRSLFYGSLSGRSDPQHVFMCLLAHSDRDGNVELPAPLIAAMCGLPQERVDAALAVLEAPDPDSRSPELDGRRLAAAGQWRWSIVNYLKYRAVRDGDERRAQTRDAVARHRGKQVKASVSQGKPLKAHAEVEVDGEVEADGEAEAETHTPAAAAPPARARRTRKPQSYVDPPGFLEFWLAFPRGDGREEAAAAFADALTRAPANEIIAGARLYAQACRQRATPPDKIKMAQGWLNGSRWRDRLEFQDAGPRLVDDRGVTPAGARAFAEKLRRDRQAQEVGNDS